MRAGDRKGLQGDILPNFGANERMRVRGHKLKPTLIGLSKKHSVSSEQHSWLKKSLPEVKGSGMQSLGGKSNPQKLSE